MELAQMLARLLLVEVAQPLEHRQHQSLLARAAKLRQPLTDLRSVERLAGVRPPVANERVELVAARALGLLKAVTTDEHVVIAHRDDDLMRSLLTQPSLK